MNINVKERLSNKTKKYKKCIYVSKYTFFILIHSEPYLKKNNDIILYCYTAHRNKIYDINNKKIKRYK